MLFLEYPKCSTCQKAKKWLDDHGIAYEDRHIKEQNPSAEELKAWHEKNGFPLKHELPAASGWRVCEAVPSREGSTVLLGMIEE